MRDIILIHVVHGGGCHAAIRKFGYSFMLRSPNQRANQIRRSYKNDEFDWLFDFVTVT